jgi:glycosyltransferase involved in cell wall biosynthesis
MTISVCIPVRNEDPELLIEVLYNFTRDYPYDELEIVFYNDGSVNTDGSFASLHNINFPQRIKNYLKIIESKEQYGVGYGMDRCVEASRGTIVVLAGADTFPQRSWFYDVKLLVKDNQIGCCASVGLNLGNYDIDAPDRTTRYGAKLLYKVTVDDLPIESKLRSNLEYRDILEGKWASKKSDEPYEISCLMGAFYFMKREFYEKTYGWDTIEGQRLIGHQGWGKLESYLSLKARVYGGKCIVYPNIRVGHVFAKFNEDEPPRAIRDDLKWFNGLFMAHTMLEESFRDELINFPHHSLNLSTAQAYIRRNWSKVQEVRDRNEREGKLLSRNDVENNV